MLKQHISTATNTATTGRRTDQAREAEFGHLCRCCDNQLMATSLFFHNITGGDMCQLAVCSSFVGSFHTSAYKFYTAVSALTKLCSSVALVLSAAG